MPQAHLIWQWYCHSVRARYAGHRCRMGWFRSRCSSTSGIVGHDEVCRCEFSLLTHSSFCQAGQASVLIPYMYATRLFGSVDEWIACCSGGSPSGTTGGRLAWPRRGLSMRPSAPRARLFHQKDPGPLLSNMYACFRDFPVQCRRVLQCQKVQWGCGVLSSVSRTCPWPSPVQCVPPPRSVLAVLASRRPTDTGITTRTQNNRGKWPLFIFISSCWHRSGKQLISPSARCTPHFNDPTTTRTFITNYGRYHTTEELLVYEVLLLQLEHEGYNSIQFRQGPVSDT